MLRRTPWALTALVLSSLGWSSTLTIEIADYASLAVTGRPEGTGQTDGLLARVNALRAEPGNDDRFFVVDLNGPLYILDKRTRAWTTYLDFNGRGERKGLFKRLSFDVGYANGLNTIRFDPDGRRNGKFYTVHTEDPAVDAPAVRRIRPALPACVSPATRRHRPSRRPVRPSESVLIEWTDTHLTNSTFEGWHAS